MKKLYIVANWKANKTVSEATEWFQKVISYKSQVISSENKEIIVCPPFTLLPLMRDFIKQHGLQIHLGAQDVSPFGTGAYTGEVAAEQLKDLAHYVIIGHSERRKNFHDDDEVIAKKVAMTNEAGLTPLLCVQGKETPVPQGVQIVAYEPVFAIGTGNPDTPENADTVAKEIKENHNVESVLYGGSVTAENVAGFTHQEHIDGVLVGGASLDTSEFINIVQNA